MNNFKINISLRRLETMRNRVRFKNILEIDPIQAELIRQQAWLNHVNEIEKAHWQSVSFMRDIRDTIKDVAILQVVKPVKQKETKREWVGLTEREVEDLKYLIDWTAHWSYGKFAKDIQDKLVEKNK